MNNFFEKLLDKYTSYFNGKYVDKIKNLELALKVLFILITALMLLLIVTVNYTIKAANEKTIEVTLNKDTLTTGGEYKIERNTASRNYFESIGYGILHEITSYDYSNVQNKSNYVLELVHPNKYEEVYESLKADAEFAVKNRVNQDFKIKDWSYRQIDSSTAQIKAYGILTRKVGGVEVIVNKKYINSVTLKISNGIPFITELQLNYADKQDAAREDRKETIENYDRKDAEGIKDEKVKK